MSIFKKLALALGVDKAIILTSSSNFISAIGGVLSIVLVIKYLTGVEQGFYYTFGSIVAIQVFFELGLNGIITQYVAHEVSNLKWENEITLSGDSRFLSRISSILHFSIKWYLTFAAFLFVSLIVIGLIFFKHYDTTNGSVNWVLPWIILAIGTSMNLLVSPIIAFLQGLGKIKEMAKIQLLQHIFRLIVVWTGLILGAKLFVLGFGSIIGSICVITLILIRYSKLLNNIWHIVINEKVHFKSEIFPYQWKIALSWISGYFIFQLFNPVLFATEGAVVAGQMGMTLTALNGILSLSLSWMSTKVPLYSGLIAQKKYEQLDNIFSKTLIQSALINTLGLGFIFFSIYILKYYEFSLGNRFLSYTPLMLLMVPIFLNHFISSWATYLRCHKQEPFLIPSIVSACAIALSTLILGNNFGIIGMTAGYCIITFFLGFVWGYIIFVNKKRIWHSKLIF